VDAGVIQNGNRPSPSAHRRQQWQGWSGGSGGADRREGGHQQQWAYLEQQQALASQEAAARSASYQQQLAWLQSQPPSPYIQQQAVQLELQHAAAMQRLALVAQQLQAQLQAPWQQGQPGGAAPITPRRLQEAGWSDAEMRLATGYLPAGAQQQGVPGAGGSVGAAAPLAGGVGSSGQAAAGGSGGLGGDAAPLASAAAAHASAPPQQHHHQHHQQQHQPPDHQQHPHEMGLDVGDCVVRHAWELRSAYCTVLGREPDWTSMHQQYRWAAGSPGGATHARCGEPSPTPHPDGDDSAP
jgi:hypothetical protein